MLSNSHHITQRNDTMKRIMLYCILIVVILFTGCGKETAEAPTTVQETILVTEESKEANSQQIEAIVQEFANAYFSADSDTMKRHLSSSNKADFTVYSEGEPSEVVVHAIKGLDNAAKDIVEKGIAAHLLNSKSPQTVTIISTCLLL